MAETPQQKDKKFSDILYVFTAISVLIVSVVLLLETVSGWFPKTASSEGSVEPPAEKFYGSSFSIPTHHDFIISGAHIYLGNGEEIENGDVFVSDGEVKAVAETLERPPNTEIIDGRGKFVTPGIIDVHSHMGVYSNPSHSATADGNEATGKATPQVWAEHSVYTQDPNYPLALAGGVTSFLVLPGSANLFGGRGVTLRNIPGMSVMDMKFPNAPHVLKMACGENPKRVYGNKGGPATRMGNMAGYRESWIKAHGYRKARDEYKDSYINSLPVEQREQAQDAFSGLMPNSKRDLAMETLTGVLDGEILVHMHCYRAEEMLLILELAEEFDYKVTAFHHAIEAYKIKDKLAERKVCAAMWADWWGFKQEAFDMVHENIAMVDSGLDDSGCAIVHSDSDVGIQRLNQEAAKAQAAGNRAGLQISNAQAMKWITLNPAKAMGIDKMTGSIEQGKLADLVIWDKDPLDSYAKVETVYIQGWKAFERGKLRPITDFELGLRDSGGNLEAF